MEWISSQTHEPVWRVLFVGALLTVTLGLILLQCLISYAPFKQTAFHTVPLSFSHWMLALAIGVLVFFAVELEKLVVRRWKARKSA